jgi:acetyl esterase
MSEVPLALRDRLERAVVRWLARLPPQVHLRLSGNAPIELDGLTLAPELQFFLALRERTGAALAATLSPGEARRRIRRDARVYAGEQVRVGAVRDLAVDGAAGPLRARHYAPERAAPRSPLLVFFHGGGFVHCDLETHDQLCRFLCRHADMHVLAVDYRLAPEEPFPAAIEDARAAFTWACARAAELGADPARVAIGGDSAGGNISAVVAQLAAREGGPAPAMQLLLYPALDRTVVRPSLERFASGFFLTRDDIAWYQEQYTGIVNADVSDPRVSPLLAPDLSGLAPALVVTAGFDPLRDEGEAYAAALRDAGTPVVLRRFEGLVHGFASMTDISRTSRDALIEIAGAMRAMLAMAPDERRVHRAGSP